MNYRSLGFNLLTSRRPFYLLSLIKVYQKIIYSDIDTVWMEDPRPYFKNNDLDFWAQIDGVIDGSPYFQGFVPFICTGFLALKSTSKTLEMLNVWQEVTSKNKLYDQEQNLLQKIAFEVGVNFGVLPTRHFPYGLIYFNAMRKKERSHVVVLHNNYVFCKEKKIQRFKDYQLWAPEFHHTSMCLNDNRIDFISTKAFKCFKDDAHFSQYAMAVHPGRVLLTEKSLSRALSKKYNNFKKDIGAYFYDATLHWKTV